MAMLRATSVSLCNQGHFACVMGAGLASARVSKAPHGVVALDGYIYSRQVYRSDRSMILAKLASSTADPPGLAA